MGLMGLSLEFASLACDVSVVDRNGAELSGKPQCLVAMVLHSHGLQQSYHTLADIVTIHRRKSCYHEFHDFLEFLEHDL